MSELLVGWRLQRIRFHGSAALKTVMDHSMDVQQVSLAVIQSSSSLLLIALMVSTCKKYCNLTLKSFILCLEYPMVKWYLVGTGRLAK